MRAMAAAAARRTVGIPTPSPMLRVLGLAVGAF
jgi:hypothetical protein